MYKGTIMKPRDLTWLDRKSECMLVNFKSRSLYLTKIK